MCASGKHLSAVFQHQFSIYPYHPYAGHLGNSTWCCLRETPCCHAGWRRIADWLRRDGSLRDHLCCPPAQGRVGQSRLLQAMSSLGFNTSMDRDSTTPLGSVCQGLMSLTVKKCLVMFSGTSRVSLGTCYLSSCHWAPLRRVWLHNLYCSIDIIRYLYIETHDYHHI